jgi:hypothetical protein
MTKQELEKHLEAEEVWKDLQGNREIYQVSNLGNFRTKERIGARGYIVCSKTKPKTLCRNGYFVVNARLKGDKKSKHYLLHRLVALMFIDNPEGKEYVNHIDGDKTNNCYYNLEWCTRGENEKHAYSIGLKNAKLDNNNRRKLSLDDALYIRKVYKKKDPVFGAKALAKRYGVSKSTIFSVVNYQNWLNEHWKEDDNDA